MSKKTTAEEPVQEQGQAVQPAASQTTSLEAAQGHDYGADAGMGRENIAREDVAIPFLTVLQSNSPQIASAEKRIKGVEIGSLFNTVTGEVYDGKKGILLVPAFTHHEYVEWVPRKDKQGKPVARQGSGFKGRHNLESPIVQKSKQDAAAEKLPFGKLYTADGSTQLVETFYLFGVLVSDAEQALPLDMVAFAFTSTKIKHFRAMLGQVFGVKNNPPLFAFLLRLSTWADKNAEGEFQNVRVLPAKGGSPSESMLPPSHPAYQAAKGLMLGLKSESKKVDYASQEASAGEGGPVDPGGVF